MVILKYALFALRCLGLVAVLGVFASPPSRAAIPPEVYKIEASPRAWTKQQVTQILTELKRRPLNQVPKEIAGSIGISANRAEWLKYVYRMNLVDHSSANALLADKLLFYRVAERELGEAVDSFVIPTYGLREFLWDEKLVDQTGQITADAEKLEAALYRRFPTGVVVRPAVGVTAKETGLGLFEDTDAFIAQLIQPNSILYRPLHMKKGVRSTVLGTIASGETVVLQADLFRAARDQIHAAGGSRQRVSQWKEVRVHTYSGRVLSSATPHPWLNRTTASDVETQEAQKLVASFLERLPRELTHQQAWSFDVAILPDGRFRIAELVTNRGKRGSWSSYLDQPHVIAAYTEALESESGVKIPGFGGWLARAGLANAPDYWNKRYSLWKKQLMSRFVAP